MRLLEFGCTLLMIGIAAAFSKIKVHMRTSLCLLRLTTSREADDAVGCR